MDVGAIVVGVGYNGFVCVVYLVWVGIFMVFVEVRDMVGGCALIVDALGARVNICNCDYIMVCIMLVIDELGLVVYGLCYLFVEFV